MRIHTLILRGGGEIEMSLPGNPILVHCGGDSVWRFVGNEETAEAVIVAARNNGCSVEEINPDRRPEEET